MRKIVPREYKYRFSSIIGGVIFLLFSVAPLIMIFVLNINVNYTDLTAKVMNILFLVIGVVWTFRELIVNFKISKLRKWRRNMLRENPISGNIESVEEEFAMPKYTRYLKTRSYGDGAVYYCLVVSYLDPKTGYKKIIRSEQYDEMLNYRLTSNEVNVYINKNNEILIDDLKTKSIIGRKPKLNIHYESKYINEYGINISAKYLKIMNFVIIIIVMLSMGVMIFI